MTDNAITCNNQIPNLQKNIPIFEIHLNISAKLHAMMWHLILYNVHHVSLQTSTLQLQRAGKLWTLE